MQSRLARVAAIVTVASVPVGCRGQSLTPSDKVIPHPQAAAASAPTSFAARQVGIHLAYPAGWTSRPSQDYLLLLTPPAEGQSRPSISLDVPDLPVHLPGMIPMGLVKKGYLDDLRQKVGQLAVLQDAAYDIPQAKAHLVQSAWQEAGRSLSETALIMIHADRVYIIRATSDAKHQADTLAAFNAIIKSIQWIK